jgi:histidinol phosphatase-like PHP family hydrolase
MHRSKRLGESDINAEISSTLRALAAAQTLTFKAKVFKRAAAAVLALDRPLDQLVGPNGDLPDIANVGPASRKVILEILRTGTSERMEREVASSPRAPDIARARSARDTFLSAAEVHDVLARPAPKGVISRTDYLGDFQMHSTWSDGTMTLAALVEGCRARGYAYAAVTDHSDGLKITKGLTAASIASQHKAIGALNRKLSGSFRLLKGVEANILADGSLDVAKDDLRRFEMVLAAPHSQLRVTTDQTSRLLKAVRTPGVHILAHPRGRQSSTRAGIVADWDRVFAAAASEGVAVEIDGTPARQDLDHTMAVRALAAGCVFALDSDAHNVAELEFSDFAIAHARLAGIPADRVVNCWKLDLLETWLRFRQKGL